jgi:hypothetical protein
MSREELELLTKEQLIEVILLQNEQAKQLAQLQAAFEKLQADYEALKLKMEQRQKPPTNSKELLAAALARSEEQCAER